MIELGLSRPFEHGQWSEEEVSNSHKRRLFDLAYTICARSDYNKIYDLIQYLSYIPGITKDYQFNLSIERLGLIWNKSKWIDDGKSSDKLNFQIDLIQSCIELIDHVYTRSEFLTRVLKEYDLRFKQRWDRKVLSDWVQGAKNEEIGGAGETALEEHRARLMFHLVSRSISQRPVLAVILQAAAFFKHLGTKVTGISLEQGHGLGVDDDGISFANFGVCISGKEESLKASIIQGGLLEINSELSEKVLNEIKRAYNSKFGRCEAELSERGGVLMPFNRDNIREMISSSNTRLIRFTNSEDKLVGFQIVIEHAQGEPLWKGVLEETQFLGMSRGMYIQLSIVDDAYERSGLLGKMHQILELIYPISRQVFFTSCYNVPVQRFAERNGYYAIGITNRNNPEDLSIDPRKLYFIYSKAPENLSSFRTDGVGLEFHLPRIKNYFKVIMREVSTMLKASSDTAVSQNLGSIINHKVNQIGVEVGNIHHALAQDTVAEITVAGINDWLIGQRLCLFSRKISSLAETLSSADPEERKRILLNIHQVAAGAALKCMRADIQDNKYEYLTGFLMSLGEYTKTCLNDGRYKDCFDTLEVVEYLMALEPELLVRSIGELCNHTQITVEEFVLRDVFGEDVLGNLPQGVSHKIFNLLLDRGD